LRAHGRAGQAQSLKRRFAHKRNTKFCGGGARLRRGFGGQARAGKNSFPPTPFLFARPSGRFGSPRRGGAAINRFV